jgi:hypothetical protein
MVGKGGEVGVGVPSGVRAALFSARVALQATTVSPAARKITTSQY